MRDVIDEVWKPELVGSRRLEVRQTNAEVYHGRRRRRRGRQRGPNIWMGWLRCRRRRNDAARHRTCCLPLISRAAKH